MSHTGREAKLNANAMHGSKAAFSCDVRRINQGGSMTKAKEVRLSKNMSGFAAKAHVEDGNENSTRDYPAELH